MPSLSKEKISEGLRLRAIVYMYRCSKSLRPRPYAMKKIKYRITWFTLAAGTQETV